MARDDENQVGSNLVAIDGTVEKQENLDIMRVIEMAGLEGVRVDRKVGDQEGLKKDRFVLEWESSKEGTNVEMYWSGERQREISITGLHLVEVI